jgi:tRNA (guanosine-2'-O-)-methyltransferase
MPELSNREIIDFLSTFITDHKKDLIDKVLANRTNYITVALEDIYQPHNASAVIRSADCFGIQNVHIIEGRNTYEVNPQVVRGSEKWLNIKKYEGEANNSASCFAELRAKGYKLVGTSPHASGYTLQDYQIKEPLALIFGTEETGLSDFAMGEVDDFIRIPMYGFTESFNLSVSAAICLYQLTSNLYSSELPWQLSDAEKEEIRLSWYKKVVRRSESLLKEHILGKNN